MVEFITPHIQNVLILVEVLMIVFTILAKGRKIGFTLTFMNLFLAILLFVNAKRFAYGGGFGDIVVVLYSFIILFIFLIQCLVIFIKSKRGSYQKVNSGGNEIG